MNKKTSKILIIGGGIAGPVLALALKKIGITATIMEAHGEIAKSRGSWLALMPNGINALRTLDLENIKTIANPSKGLAFYNHKGKGLGRIDHTSFEKKFNSPSLVMKRSVLHEFLHREVEQKGIPVLFNKRLKGIEEKQGEKVVAYFEDGSSYEADIVVGCDGIYSKTREHVLKTSVNPCYTGVVGYAGFSNMGLNQLGEEVDMTMTFGKKAFFGYFPATCDETFWYSNIPIKTEINRNDPLIQSEIKELLYDFHRQDPGPILELIQNTHTIDRWVIHDLPALPYWYSGSVVLAGDSAHATSPHGAQGASLAIEDAVVLSMCIRDLDDKSVIFKTYQHLRKVRVEKQAKQARQRGKQNLILNPVSIFARDIFMPIALRKGWVNENWLHSYSIDWNRKTI